MGNSDYKIKYVAPTKKFALALESQTFIPLTLSGTRALTESDNNIFIINAAEETNVEKNETTKYRIQGRLQIVTDNTIVPAWDTEPIPDSAWTPETEGVGLDKSFIPRNWVLSISYPYKNVDEANVVAADKNKTVVGTNTNFTTIAYEGFQIVELLPFNYKSGITNILIRTQQKHGFIDLDDYIYIAPKANFINDGVDTFRYLGFHQILDFEPGNEEFGLILNTEYIPSTNFDFLGNQIPVPFLGVGKRVFEPSSNDITFSNPINVTQIQASNVSGTTSGTTIYTKIFSQQHDLKVNDFIEVRVYNNLTLPNLYKVVATPTPDTFVIKYNILSQNAFAVQPINYNLTYKFLDGVPSEYYYRQNKLLTGPKDYQVYKAGFSKNIFNDGYINDVFLFHFDKDIDVGNLKDNLGRPLTNLYLTIIKRASSGNNNYDGFKKWAENYQILEGNRTYTPIFDQNNPVVTSVLSYWQNNNPLTAGSYLSEGALIYNDFVEYNRAFLTERVLSNTLGKFAPSQVYPVPNTTPPTYEYDTREGYTYKIHQEINIRKFSNRIETTANRSNEIYPDYVQVNNDGTVSWRDLLPIGFFEPSENNTSNGIDYPFVNAKHYLFGEYPIYIRRQTATTTKEDIFVLNKFVKFNTDSTPNDEC